MPGDDELRHELEKIEEELWRDLELAHDAASEPERRWGGALVCVECGRASKRGRGWRALVIDFAPSEVAVYCPPCAEREFAPG